MKELTLKRFSEISAQINSTEDIHDLLILIMDTAKDLLESEGSSLLLYDEKEDELFFDIVRGPKGNLLANQRLKIGEGIAGLVAKTQKAIIVNDAQNDTRVSKKFDKRINFQTKNILAVPLKTRERLIGVLEIVNSRLRDTFSEDDKELLMHLSNQAALAINNRNLFQNLKDRMDELSCLYEIVQTISSDYDFIRNADNILRSICNSLSVKRLSLLISDDNESMRIVSSIGLNINRNKLIENMKNGIAGYVYKTGDSLLIRDLKNDIPENEFFSLGTYKTKSFVTIPVNHKGKVIGVLNITEKQDGEPFDSNDFRILTTIGEQISGAYANYKSHEEHLAMEQMKRDLHTASLIQMNSLPHLPKTFSELEIAFHYESCEAVGGDFYDMIIHGERLVSFVIGDVSGKGVGAALFMEHVKTLLQSYIPRFKNPRTSIAELNRKILSEKGLVIFVTTMIMQVDIENRSFRYASAGHNNQYLIRAKGAVVEKVSGKGAPAGAFPQDKYKEFVLSFNKGDYLFLYTDGISEAMNQDKEVYGDGRLVKLLEGMASSLNKFTPQTFISTLLDDVRLYSAGTPLHDDQTMLVVKL